MTEATTERAGSVEFRVLGDVEVVADGQPLALEGRKSRELLAYLLLHANTPVSQSRIVDALWGDDAPLTVDASLRVAVSKLRRALAPVGARGLLETRPSGYLLHVEQGQVDASVFEALAADGHAHLEAEQWHEASSRLVEALALWRGGPYAEIAQSPEGSAEAKRLTSRRLDVEDDLSETRLALGQHETLVPDLETLVDQRPTRERRAAQLMLALYRSGRQTEALDVYTRTREALGGELGLEPGPELRALQQAILRHDPTLEISRGRRTVVAGRRRVGLAVAIALAVAVAVAVAGALAPSRRSSAPPPDVPANSVAIVDVRDAAVRGSAPTGSRPTQVVLVDGSAWVANAEEGTITQIDVESREVVRTIGIGFEPTGLAAGADAVWVAGGYDHQLFRIDTSDGRVRLRVRFVEALGPLPDGYERGPAGVAVGTEGVWVSHGVELTLFDPGTGEVRRTVRAGGPWVSQIAVGEGFVWVAYDGALESTGALRGAPGLDAVRLAPNPRRTRIPLLGHVTDVEVGDGSAWTAIGRGDAVWRIDPTTLSVAATMPAGDSPTSIAVDGGVWVSNRADATVTKLDARSGTKLDVIPVGHTLEDIATGDGEVWVAVRAP